MDLAALNLALKTRAYTDTGAGGLRNADSPLITGWYPTRFDPSLQFPYVVTSIAASASDNAFSLDVGRVTMYFHIWHQKEGTDDENPTLTCSNIIKRIYGNWASSSPTVAPTWGFHRHPLTIASGTWRVAGALQCTAPLPIENHEPRYLHYVMPFAFFLNQ